jgi:ABC-2 type transporter.
MIKELFLYRLQILLKRKINLFWSLIFPIILVSFYNIALVGAFSSESFESIPIGVVITAQTPENNTLQDVIKNAKNEEKMLFDYSVYSKEDAQTALRTNEIGGYFLLQEDIPILVVQKAGINQTIMEQFLAEFLTITKIVEDIARENPALLATNIIDKLQENNNYISEIKYSDNVPNALHMCFFAAVAMACISGMNWGTTNAEDYLANQSPKGIRVYVSPINKTKLMLINTAASITILFTEILILLGYIILILDVDFGNRIAQILLTCFLGTLYSISLGTLIGNIVKDEKLTYGIAVFLASFGGFLSGLMAPNMKNVVDQISPMINKINPTGIITDCFYQLYYFTDLSGFYTNIVIIIALMSVMFLVNIYVMRRENYVSI